jgi:NADH:ubiquinone oxidoreductase subunit D
MRAAGLNFDLRRSRPFYFYQDIDFDIPVGIFGTAYDRYLVRYEEIYQSFRIISQVLDNLPLGDICLATKDKNSQSNDLGFLYDDVKSDWFYASLESPNGEAGYNFFLTNDFKFERIKIKTPSFVIAQAMPFFLNGLSRDQIPSAVASLGISRWEIDR